jgi:uncharacterized protein YjdB
VRCGINTTYEDRTATVNIRMEDLSQSVSVRQPANLGVVLPKQVFDLQSGANSIDVEVQANVRYTVSTSVDWIKQTGTKGLTSKTLTFSVEENKTYDYREGKITIKPQEGNEQEQVISVTQAQKDALNVEKTSYDMPYGGGVIEIKVESNVSFDVTPNVDWIHHTQTKALSNSTVYLQIGENPTYSARKGTIEIKQQNGALKHTITVNQAGRVAVTSIKLDKTSLMINVGDSETLVATIQPENATDKEVSWSSSDSAIAVVDETGKVTAVKEGSATITAKVGEKTAECKVTVYVAVTSVSLNKASLTLLVGESETLTATVKPDNATDKTVTWSSSDEQIATVVAGTVTAIKVGEVTITAKSGDKKAECKVMVNPLPVSSITLDQTSIKVKVGQTATLVATVKPDDATDKTVSWSSNNTNIVTVENGVVTGIKSGSAVVTAKAGDKTAKCEVRVLSETNEGIYAAYYGGAIVSINGYLQSGSKLNYGVVNNTTETITIVSVQLIDGVSGSKGNVMSINSNIESGQSSAWTITIKASIQSPIARFVYKFKGTEYTCEAQYTSISF